MNNFSTVALNKNIWQWSDWYYVFRVFADAVRLAPYDSEDDDY